nr:reverse transcriptase domain-containing protein [Tanacetum cinerariifolium]
WKRLLLSRLEAATSPMRNDVVTLIISSIDLGILSCSRLISSGLVIPKFCPEIKNQLIPVNTPLVGFSGETIWPLGQISFLVKIGDEEHSTGKEDPSKPIHGARNDKIPSGWRNSHIAEQQDHPAIMLNGFGTRSTAVYMTGVPRHIAEHRLNVREGCLPLENVREFQGLKQSVPQRWLSATGNRLEEGAFKEMKQLIVELPMLTTPKEKEELVIYLAAATEAINAVLMTERDGKQVPIYFISRALQGQKILYTPIEKLILALVSSSEQLKRYFQAHTIVVITDQPIKQLLSNPEVTGRLLKWRFELGEHDIQYRPRTSVKGQILTDFIVECPKDDTSDTSMKDREELPDPWILFMDRSSCIDGFEAGLIITNLEGMEFTYTLREKAIYKKKILAVVEEEGHSWMTPVYEYLTKGILLEEKKKARAVRRKAGRYAVHRPMPRNPPEKLTPITSPWPFYKWGIDIAGPFLEGPSKVKFLIVAMDYFTKWIEARPMATITGAQNNEAFGINLDLLEEKREQVAIQEAMNKAKIERYYNARVRITSFRPEDFVYRSNEASHAKDGGKLEPKWEGPYEVTETLGITACWLRDRNGHTLPRTWSICNLKKCYMH